MQLSDADTQETINSILDNPAMMACISSSKWPATRIITKESRHSLLQNLVLDELVTKRAQHLSAFIRGLEKFGVAALCRQYPEKCAELFVFNETARLNADKFLQLIVSTPETSQERETLDWFVEYATVRETDCCGKCKY